ncbi:MAG: hypothetical protein AAGA18_14970, partial [Verrucomicrobiota bacterium]
TKTTNYDKPFRPVQDKPLEVNSVIPPTTTLSMTLRVFSYGASIDAYSSLFYLAQAFLHLVQLLLGNPVSSLVNFITADFTKKALSPY